MPHSYSTDLRWRIVCLYQEKSFDEIEKLLFVSSRSARRYVALFYETGEVSPVSQQHGPPRTLDSFEEMTLIQSLLNKPDMYLEELRQELLQVTGVEVSLSTVCRTLKLPISMPICLCGLMSVAQTGEMRSGSMDTALGG